MVAICSLAHTTESKYKTPPIVFLIGINYSSKINDKKKNCVVDDRNPIRIKDSTNDVVTWILIGSLLVDELRDQQVAQC